MDSIRKAKSEEVYRKLAALNEQSSDRDFAHASKELYRISEKHLRENLEENRVIHPHPACKRAIENVLRIAVKKNGANFHSIVFGKSYWDDAFKETLQKLYSAIIALKSQSDVEDDEVLILIEFLNLQQGKNFLRANPPYTRLADVIRSAEIDEHELNLIQLVNISKIVFRLWKFIEKEIEDMERLKQLYEKLQNAFDKVKTKSNLKRGLAIWFLHAKVGVEFHEFELHFKRPNLYPAFWDSEKETSPFRWQELCDLVNSLSIKENTLIQYNLRFEKFVTTNCLTSPIWENIKRYSTMRAKKRIRND